MIEKKIPGNIQRRFFKNICWQDEYGRDSWTRKETDIEDAEVVSSKIAHSDRHAPAIDIDVPAYLIPSSTPGHSHLYIDVAMSWRQYKKLLKALDQAGIVEYGYLRASLKRKRTDLRVPWLKKGM